MIAWAGDPDARAAAMRSAVCSRLGCRSARRSAHQIYARGLSVRDVEDCFRDATGALLISRSAVSEITTSWGSTTRGSATETCPSSTSAISFSTPSTRASAATEPRRGSSPPGPSPQNGRKVLLHLAVGNKESEACWTEFLRNLVARGLRMPRSVTSDGAPGLLNAITQVFAKSLRIRCWYHKMANIRSKLSADDAPEVLAHIRAIRDAANCEAGRAMAAQVIETFADRFPSAMACLSDDLGASLAHLKLPVRHRVSARTTTLLERSFEEERRRTKVIPRLLDEKSAMKLVFATLMRVRTAGTGCQSMNSSASSDSCAGSSVSTLTPNPPPKPDTSADRKRRVAARYELRDSGQRVYRMLRT
jgi:putative transposase